MTHPAQSLTRLRQRMVQACAAAGRDAAAVNLLAVSKGFGAEAVRQLFAAGQTDFGESYVQEALPKQAQLADLPIAWHHIGPIQSNKTQDIARHFDWVHGVDRLKIAERLASARDASGAPLNVCVQVNISGEASKAGCAPEAAPALCRAIAGLGPNLRLRGLMAIPAPSSPETDARTPFRALRQLFEQIRAQGLALDTISAGMSDDLESAIAEGSTLVRIGTALFGPRDQP